MALGVLTSLTAAGVALAVRPSEPVRRPAPLLVAVADANGATYPAGVGDAGATAAERAERAAVGRQVFFDETLSEPRGTSCASCHDPAQGFAGNHGSTSGVALGSRAGHFARRNTPSVLYLKFVRRFHVHWEEDAPLIDAFGGFFWDGRTDSLVDLIKQPLLNADEMNGGSAAQVAAKLRATPYADELRRQYGDAVDDPEKAVEAAGRAVEAYLTSPEMSPFSSRYDDYIRGRARLTESELRGLRLFKDSAKGGCSACHKLNDQLPVPERSLFSDYAYDAVGIPRNREIARNADPVSFDLGLCQRPDPRYHSDDPQFCGSFRTPSLRNVAVRRRFMHNGVFASLREVVSFYATRGTDPKRWYKHGEPFDDVPARYRPYVNVDKAPYNRREGQKPPLDDQDVDAIVAFLGTLTDAQFR